jgi:hypothetical protein
MQLSTYFIHFIDILSITMSKTRSVTMLVIPRNDLSLFF